MSCGVGHRCSSDLTLLWRWCRLVATAPIRPLAWEPPYARGTAQEMAKRPKKKKKKKELQYLKYKILFTKHAILTLARLPPHGQGISSYHLGSFDLLFFLSGPTLISFPTKKEKEEFPLRFQFGNNMNSSYHLLSTYYVLDSILRNFIDSASFNPHKNLLSEHYYFFPFCKWGNRFTKTG